MNATQNTSKVSFYVDRKGKRTHALLPIKEYERLIEDQYDFEVSESRKHEEPVSFEEAKARIRSRRVSN